MFPNTDDALVAAAKLSHQYIRFVIIYTYVHSLLIFNFNLCHGKVFSFFILFGILHYAFELFTAVILELSYSCEYERIKLYLVSCCFLPVVYLNVFSSS